MPSGVRGYLQDDMWMLVAAYCCPKGFVANYLDLTGAPGDSRTLQLRDPRFHADDFTANSEIRAVPGANSVMLVATTRIPKGAPIWTAFPNMYWWTGSASPTVARMWRVITALMAVRPQPTWTTYEVRDNVFYFITCHLYLDDRDVVSAGRVDLSYTP